MLACGICHECHQIPYPKSTQQQPQEVPVHGPGMCGMQPMQVHANGASHAAAGTGRKYILKHSSRCTPNSRRTRRRMRWWIVYNENPNTATSYFHAAEKSSCKDGGEDYGTTTSCQPEPSFQVMQATMLVLNNLSPQTPNICIESISIQKEVLKRVWYYRQLCLQKFVPYNIILDDVVCHNFVEACECLLHFLTVPTMSHHTLVFAGIVNHQDQVTCTDSRRDWSSYNQNKTKEVTDHHSVPLSKSPLSFPTISSHHRMIA